MQLTCANCSSKINTIMNGSWISFGIPTTQLFVTNGTFHLTFVLLMFIARYFTGFRTILIKPLQIHRTAAFQRVNTENTFITSKYSTFDSLKMQSVG